jgi:uncharacterized RDD family membrane protein YckC
MTSGVAAADLPPVAPSLRRRLACFVYEGVLLFGVLMMAGYLFSTLTQQRHGLAHRHGLQLFLFVVLGIYFVFFWSHGGQTVAMKAWRIRVVDRHGHPLSQPRALLRYLLSWLWFLPAWIATAALRTPSAGVMFGAMFAGVLAWALLSRVHPTRQFLHDAMSGTCLVTTDGRP